MPCRAETLPLFLAIALALLCIQTEQTLPLIRLTSSLFVAALETTLYAFFFNSLSLSTKKATDSHKQQMDLLFAYQNVFCCVGEKASEPSIHSLYRKAEP